MSGPHDASPPTAPGTEAPGRPVTPAASPAEAPAFLEALLQALPVYIVRFDDQLRILYVNRFQPGHAPDEYLGQPALEFIDAADRPLARRCVEEAFATGEPRSYETLGPGPGGAHSPYQVFVAPVRQADGRLEGCFVALDTSALRERDRSLERVERRLRIALRATGLGLWSWDLETGELLWDDAMRRALGREAPLSLQDYVAQAVHPDDRKAVDAAGARAMATGMFDPIPHRIVRPDGEVRWMLTVGEMERAADGRPIGILGGNLDITEQRRLEEELRHAQKLESIGRLTAGVAHNFNNMLMALMPTVELLREVVPETHHGLVDDALGAAERAADLVRKLMTFAGQRRPRAAGPCDLSALVHRVVAMCQRTFGSRIEVCAEEVTPGVLVASDEADLEQVLMNLLLNARDAVVAAGRGRSRVVVTLRVGTTTAAGGGARRHAVLAVRDEGTGMSEEALRHLFVPFFTSKGVGRGTGLGLATSYAVARGLGGRIDVETAPGRGTTVSVVLPVADAPVAAPETIRPSRQPPARLRVLLVDDEPLVRRVIPEVLALEGCSVRAVADAESARQEAQREPPDVVLLDRSLPGVSGANLLAELRALVPSARLVWFTGQEVPPGDGEVADAVVHKPIRGAELARVLLDLVRS